jgi:DNA-binding transcriptional LysR family regulator
VQSAVSQGISNLEKTLGVSLFERSGRRPKLTAAGRSLLLDTYQIFAQVGQLRTRATAIANNLEAEVSVVVDAIVPANLLVEMCRVFQVKFPTVSLRIHTEVLGAVADLVLDRSCHLGITGPIGADNAGLTCRFLTNIEMVPVAGPDHHLASIEGPIPTSSVRDQIQVVISERGKATSGDRGVLSSQTWRVADGSTKLALIRAGLGWGNLPVEMVHDDLKADTLVQLRMEEWGSKPMVAPLSSIVRTDLPLGPAGQWLLQQLNEISQ